MGGTKEHARASKRVLLDALLVQSRDRRCAIPLAHVIETMRPLPVASIAGMPDFVRGLAVIRGSMTPVIDVGALFGGATATVAARFVTIRVDDHAAGTRTAALAVTSVAGVRQFDLAEFDSLPPLLAHTRAEAVTAIGVLDDGILLLLEAGRIVPDDVWAGLSEAS